MSNSIDLISGIYMKWRDMTPETKVQIVLSMGTLTGPPMPRIDQIFTAMDLEIILCLENGAVCLRMTDKSLAFVKNMIDVLTP